MNLRLALLVGSLIASSVSAQTIRIPQDCRETLPAEVTIHLKPEGRDDAAVRSALRTAASVDAVQQTTGTQVRSKASIELSSVRGTDTGTKTDHRFTQRMVSQAAGLVALTVIDESVTQDQASLHAIASVCIPRDPAALKETVSIGGFLSSRGEALQEGVSALRDGFSASRSFAETDNPENADWVIDGRIDSVDVRKVTGTGTSISGQPSITGGNAPANFQRLQVSGHVDARNADGQRVTVKFDKTRNIAESREAVDALNEWVPALLSETSRELEGRLVAQRTGASEQQKSQGPKW